MLQEQEKEFVAIALTGSTIQLLWVIPDYLLVPELWDHILVTRLFVFLTVVPLVLLRKRIGFSALACNVVNGLEIAVFSAYCMSIVPLAAFPYYALGEIVFFVAMGMVVTWEMKYSLLLIIVSILSFALMFTLFSSITTSEMLTNGGIAALTIAILSILMVNMRYSFRLRELKARIDLERSLNVVKAKTQENELLTKQLQQKERNVIISDITSSFAHELNTPLSVMIHSTGIIDRQLKELIKCGFKGIPHSELVDLLRLLDGRAMNHSGTRRIAEAEGLKDLLTKKLGESGIQIAEELANIGVTKEDKIIIEQILQKEDPATYTAVLKQLKILEEMMGNIASTSTRMVSIVKDIKKLEAKERVTEFAEIDLRDSVLQAFHAIEHSARYNFKINLVELNKAFVFQDELNVVLFLIKLMDYILLHSGEDQLKELYVELSAEDGMAVINIRVNEFFVEHYMTSKGINSTDSFVTDQPFKDLNLLILKAMCDELNAKSDIIQNNGAAYFNLKLSGVGTHVK
jgi:signal transduction histidine kinase